MSVFILLAEADRGGRVGEIARTFGVDWPHLVAQIISFGIVCLLLQRFAYRPVLAMLETRRQRIAEGLANAEKIKAELARAETQRQEVLRQANTQADKLIEEAHAAAARVLERETQRALAAAQDIITKAHAVAARDHERMRRELRGEIGHLVVDTTAVVTAKILTDEDQRRIAEETAKHLAA